MYGLPETLVVDREPHLVSGDLADACGPLGIHLDPTPVRRPWFKGAIERQFRTQNTGLVHGLPGTTFSHVLARGEYDAAGMACISLTRFREMLHVYLMDVYGQEWNREVGGVAAQRWPGVGGPSTRARLCGHDPHGQRVPGPRLHNHHCVATGLRSQPLPVQPMRACPGAPLRLVPPV